MIRAAALSIALHVLVGWAFIADARAAALCPKPHRSRSVIEEFKKLYPCPRSCRTYVIQKGHFKVYEKCGACAVDHVCPVAACGKDAGFNLQWLSARENRQKSDDPSECTREAVDWDAVDRALAEAVKRTDEKKADALRKMREELEAIVRKNTGGP